MSHFFQTRIGKIVLIAVVIICSGLAALQVRGLFRTSDAAARLNQRWMICTETRKAFLVDLASLKEIPCLSPFSGKKTGVPAELCYWTADGHIKADPTPVLLNQYLNDPSPTFCPDCGRLVTERNPPPNPAHPPPTRQEYKGQ